MCKSIAFTESGLEILNGQDWHLAIYECIHSYSINVKNMFLILSIFSWLLIDNSCRNFIYIDRTVFEMLKRKINVR